MWESIYTLALIAIAHDIYFTWHVSFKVHQIFSAFGLFGYLNQFYAALGKTYFEHFDGNISLVEHETILK